MSDHLPIGVHVARGLLYLLGHASHSMREEQGRDGKPEKASVPGPGESAAPEGASAEARSESATEHDLFELLERAARGEEVPSWPVLSRSPAAAEVPLPAEVSLLAKVPPAPSETPARRGVPESAPELSKRDRAPANPRPERAEPSPMRSPMAESTRPPRIALMRDPRWRLLRQLVIRPGVDPETVEGLVCWLEAENGPARGPETEG